jgi:hypothetical protein
VLFFGLLLRRFLFLAWILFLLLALPGRIGLVRGYPQLLIDRLAVRIFLFPATDVCFVQKMFGLGHVVLRGGTTVHPGWDAAIWKRFVAARRGLCPAKLNNPARFGVQLITCSRNGK